MLMRHKPSEHLTSWMFLQLDVAASRFTCCRGRRLTISFQVAMRGSLRCDCCFRETRPGCVCPVSALSVAFASFCFRCASFLVGAVPKTGNDLAGIPGRRRCLRYFSPFTSHSRCRSRRERTKILASSAPVLPWHTPDVDLDKRERQNWFHRWPQRVL